ncbi:MAG: META domain-containing protein [Treponema sp.]|nr:META domain-containing protein [Treponema sp.]
MKIKFIPFLLLGLMFFGCAGKKVDLNGDWKVTALIIDGVNQPVVENNLTVTQKVKTLHVAGNSGVNSIQGDIYVSNNSKLKISNKFLSTRMMGPEKEQFFEDTYVHALMNADSYEYDGKLLKIIDSKDKVEIQLTR